MSDWQQFAVAMTGHLAWPIAVLAIFSVIRAPIVRLVKGIRGFKYAGAEVEFEQQVEEARLAIARSASDQGGAITPPRLAGVDTGTPNVAKFLTAWAELERIVARRIEARTGQRPTPDADLFDAGAKAGVLSPDHIKGLHSLRTMRNLALHFPETSGSDEHLKKYLILADVFATLLRQPP